MRCTILMIVFLFLLLGCGEDFATYERPSAGLASPNETAEEHADRIERSESAWHRCMRQTSALHRWECRDLK